MALEKHIRLSAQAEEILSEIKEEKGFSSLNRTLEYMITDYANNRDLAKNVSDRVTESLNKALTRIRLGTNTADVNSQIIIELLNSIIYQFDVAPMTTELNETATVAVSRQRVKDRIALFKQRKDNKPGGNKE